ncbi:MAG: hypothetical protein GXO73_03355 [Calditrichaeota bacterium]|nr:hypothetical protein [Calditrichota bacterium]
MWAVLVAAAVAFVWPQTGSAIPAFARKYRLSCSTCHAPVPRLKAYGEDFAGNAFQLEGKEPVRFFRDTGDPILTLQRELPIAVRFDNYFRVQTKEGARKSDFQMPYYLKFLSGGQIAKDVSYYFYFFFSERGEVAGVEDAYVHFNNLFGTDLDLMIGQFQVSDPLFKRELRLTYEDYQIYRVRVGAARANLTYDRGLMLTYGTSFGSDVVLEVLNGNGKSPADALRNFDTDNYKNVLLRVSQSVGNVRIGGFGYYGKEEKYKELFPSGSQPTREWVTDRFHYLGVDATVDFSKSLQLNAQAIVRRDDNPYFMRVHPVEVETRGYIVELIWALHGEMGRPFLTLLYNRVDGESSPELLNLGLDYESFTASYSYLLHRNLRLVFEGTYDKRAKNTRLLAGFVSAF